MKDCLKITDNKQYLRQYISSYFYISTGRLEDKLIKEDLVEHCCARQERLEFEK